MWFCEFPQSGVGRCRNREFFQEKRQYRIATAGQNCYHKIHKTQEDGGTALRRKRDRNFGIRWLRDLLCGVLIGAGAILPGVSGGVLAVVFDIYRPFMEVLTHPREAIPKYWRWFLPIGAGVRHRLSGLCQGHRRGHRRVQHRHYLAVHRPDRGHGPISLPGSGEGGTQHRLLGQHGGVRRRHLLQSVLRRKSDLRHRGTQFLVV